MARMVDVGADLKQTGGLNVAAQSAGAVNGPAIDRMANQYESCQVHVRVGAPTGTPTSFTVDVKLQHSDDGSTGWADYAGQGAGATTAAVPTLNAANTEQRKNYVLLGAKRYLRLVSTVAFVGGTTPAVPVSGNIGFGSGRNTPAT